MLSERMYRMGVVEVVVGVFGLFVFGFERDGALSYFRVWRGISVCSFKMISASFYYGGFLNFRNRLRGSIKKSIRGYL